MLQYLAAVLVIPPALPGHWLGKESAVFRPLLRGEGVQPIAKSVYVISPYPMPPANGVCSDLPWAEPGDGMIFLSCSAIGFVLSYPSSFWFHSSSVTSLFRI